MKTRLLILLLTLSCVSLFSQQFRTDSIIPKLSNNTISIDETFGSNISATMSQTISLNYERLLFKNKSNSFYYFIKAGIGKVQANLLFQDFSPEYQLPLSIVLLTGKNSGHFELNLGARMLYDKIYEPKFSLFPILDLGYRFQAPQNGFFFKALVGTVGITFGVGYAF